MKVNQLLESLSRAEITKTIKTLVTELKPFKLKKLEYEKPNWVNDKRGHFQYKFTAGNPDDILDLLVSKGLEKISSDTVQLEQGSSYVRVLVDRSHARRLVIAVGTGVVHGKPLTDENILAALPGSPGDVLFHLGYDDQSYLNKVGKVIKILDRLCDEGKVVGHPRPADDSFYSKK